jgi:Spy/CpxP family protein refolding chaperone
MSPQEAPKQDFNKPRRPNLLAELDLSSEQIQQIRRINADKRPLMREAQMKIREANRRLDAAIYADRADEAEIQTRLKDVQAAQAEVSKIRSMTEYAVRLVLTPAQLLKFREVRQRFMENVENRMNQPRNRPPANENPRFVNRRRGIRPND